MSIINGATCNGTTTTGCGNIPPTVSGGGPGPYDVSIDQNTHTVFVLNFAPSVTITNGVTCHAGHLSGCTRTPPTVQVGVGGGGLDVDSTTHTAHIANQFDSNVSMNGPTTCS